MILAPVARRPPGWLVQTALMAKKEMRHLLRSPRDLLLVLAMPAALTFLFGYAFEVGEVKHVPTAIVDEDGSPLARRLAGALARDDTFRVVSLSGDAREEMDRDRVLAVVRIPAGTARRAETEGAAPIPVALSGIDTDSAPSALRALTRILGSESRKIAGRRLARLGLDGARIEDALQPLAPALEVRDNPEMKFIRYVMPGIIGLVLQLVTVGLVAGTLTREKELVTYEALLASPIAPSALVAGKCLPYLLVSGFEVVLVLAIANAAFSVSLGSGALPAVVVTVAFVLAAIATGLLVSTVAGDQAQSLHLTVFYGLPAFLLSGALAPATIMPDGVRLLAKVFPLTYFCHAFRDVSLKGLPLASVAPDVGMLLAHAAILMLLSVGLFRRRLA